MSLPDKILDLLKQQAQAEHTYINPHFLSELSNLLEQYYKLEDDEVDSWIADMYGC